MDDFVEGHEIRIPDQTGKDVTDEYVIGPVTSVTEIVPHEEASRQLVLPTGELIDVSDPASCALALTRIREMESFIREAKGAVVDALAEEAKRRGENTFELDDGTKVVVKKNADITWDAEGLEEALRAAGMPEDRIREIIVEEVTHTVKAIEANKAAKANPDYAKAIQDARSEVEKRPSISLPRG